MKPKVTNFQVQRKACGTCIYGPDSPTRRSVKELENECRDRKTPWFFRSYRVCHYSQTACCRGFWERHKDAFAAGQIAQRLGRVEEVDHQ